MADPRTTPKPPAGGDTADADQARRPDPPYDPGPSTGVMKALVLVDDLRAQRLSADEARRARLMGRPPKD